MLAFLREANTSKSVTDVLNYLYKELVSRLYKSLFPLILTDNGSKFSNPKGIEEPDKLAGIQTRVFYCDPRKPY